MHIEVGNPVDQRDRIGAGKRNDRWLRMAGDQAMHARHRHRSRFPHDDAVFDEGEAGRWRNIADFVRLSSIS
jgi:hypothetical protein